MGNKSVSDDRITLLRVLGASWVLLICLSLGGTVALLVYVIDGHFDQALSLPIPVVVACAAMILLRRNSINRKRYIR